MSAADQLATMLGPEQMAALLGPSWKSRQPRMCQYCQRMFSNKFNLKQVHRLSSFYNLWSKFLFSTLERMNSFLFRDEIELRQSKQVYCSIGGIPELPSTFNFSSNFSKRKRAALWISIVLMPIRIRTSILMPFQIRIRNGFNVDRMRILPPRFTDVGKSEKNLTQITSVPLLLFNVVDW